MPQLLGHKTDWKLIFLLPCCAAGVELWMGVSLFGKPWRTSLLSHLGLINLSTTDYTLGWMFTHIGGSNHVDGVTYVTLFEQSFFPSFY